MLRKYCSVSYHDLPWLVVVHNRSQLSSYQLRQIIPGGGVLSPKSYVDVPAGPRKSNYLYTNFLPNFPPISIPFLEEKHPIWIKLGAFYNNLPKIHPIYVIWAPSSLMKTPRSLYQISRKGAKKGRHIYVYHVNVRTPPPPREIIMPLKVSILFVLQSLILLVLISRKWDSFWLILEVWHCLHNLSM